MRLRRLPALFFLLAALLSAPAAAKAQSEPLLDSGPTGLVILYRVPPASRAEFRRTMRTAGLARLRQLRTEGDFAEGHLYFSRYAESDSWDMVLSLQFDNYAQVSRWNHVEAETPGGLPTAAQSLTTAISTYPVDSVFARAVAGRTDGGHVMLLVPYNVVVPTPEYERYAAGYVQPQLDGWMEAGILTHYELAVGRGAAGKPYSSFLLLEYKDDESFGRRDRVLAETRQRLQSNAAWKTWSENKQTIRSERPAIIMDELR
jgi:hypothetical protein